VVDGGIGLSKQCKLAGVARATLYDKKRRLQGKVDEAELILLELLDAEYTRHPFYGSRRMTIWLRLCGHHINRKHVQRLMQKLGLAGMAPGPNTSVAHPEHKIYPYLLRGLPIVRPKQVWSTDITYVRLSRGFVYLVVIMDWYSRKVLSWRLSNTMDAGFCVDCLEEAIRQYGRPEIFNSDQGSQFTSDSFTKVLKDNGITISMDGRGRAMDNIFVERLWRNVKYEDIYLNGYATMSELLLGLTKYFVFYNGERPHQSLDYNTPDRVYMTAMRGGALSVDKFGGAGEEPLVPLRSTTVSSPAEATSRSTATAKPGQRRAAACAESTLN
jgi:putative transposase